VPQFRAEQLQANERPKAVEAVLPFVGPLAPPVELTHRSLTDRRGQVPFEPFASFALATGRVN